MSVAADRVTRLDVGVSVDIEPVPRGMTRAVAIHNASRIMLWHATAIPWIARTEEYTHALIRDRLTVQEDPDLTAMFRTVEAQTLLERVHVKKVMFIGAAALRQSYNENPAIQQEQLDHLASLVSDSGGALRLRVLPTNANASIVADRPPLTLYERNPGAPLVEEETWAGGVVITGDSYAVSEARTAFAALHDRALSHDDSTAFLQSVIEDLRVD
jgi:hypothetical protein